MAPDERKVIDTVLKNGLLATIVYLRTGMQIRFFVEMRHPHDLSNCAQPTCRKQLDAGRLSGLFLVDKL